VVQIVLWYLDSGCSKHMTRDCSQLINFVQKFLGTVKFGNDHVAKIMGYEVVATACFTQNRSIIRLRHGKTPYELLQNKLPDLSFLYLFGALCYPTNDSENLEKLQPKSNIGIFIGYAPTKKAFWIYNRRTRRIVETIHVDFDELTKMASEQSSSGPALNEMTPATISSGLVQKSSSSTPYVPPLRNGWDLLFQPMFDKLLNPLPSVDHQAPEVIAPIGEVIPPVQADSTDVEEDNLNTEVPHIGNDSLFGVPILEVTSAQSSSTVSPHSIVQPDHQIPQHSSKWTKDHPLHNIIGQLSRPISTRLQLHEQALFCYYDAFMTSVEPKTYKEALTQSCWIEAMQEELNEFEQLEVWELVPHPDKVMLASVIEFARSYRLFHGLFLVLTMDTIIEQQVTTDKALVPHAQRLRIGRSNFCLLSDIKSKESTLQLVYDVLRMCPFFKAFLVIADVSEIYMHEFWATATVHHHAIRFKLDNKKHIINLESFRDMLHICPRVPGQSFVKPPFEEEILAFIRFLRHSAVIRKLSDVNINKLYQPWRSFAAIINKCLTEKSSGYDSLRLSQAQIL
nr:hypothetical protein [Tanacetum cinerariifolium]